MQSMFENWDFLERYFPGYQLVALLARFHEDEIRKMKLPLDFKKIGVAFLNSFSISSHARDPLETIRKRIYVINLPKILPEPCKGPVYTYSMNSILGYSAYKEILKQIKQGSKNGLWKDEGEVELTLTVGYIKLFSDEPHVSPSTSSEVLYTLHVTMLSFAKEVRRLYISQGHTTKGYLLVSFKVSTKQLGPEKSTIIILSKTETKLQRDCLVGSTSNRQKTWKIYYHSN